MLTDESASERIAAVADTMRYLVRGHEDEAYEADVLDAADQLDDLTPSDLVATPVCPVCEQSACEATCPLAPLRPR